VKCVGVIPYPARKNNNPIDELCHSSRIATVRKCLMQHLKKGFDYCADQCSGLVVEKARNDVSIS